MITTHDSWYTIKVLPDEPEGWWNRYSWCCQYFRVPITTGFCHPTWSFQHGEFRFKNEQDYAMFLLRWA